MRSAASRNQQVVAPVRLDRRQWLTLVVLTVSTFVVLLDASVVNIALPVIVRDLGGSFDASTWLLAGFVLSFAVLLLPAARLADLYGRRLLFVLGMAVFALASLWCALGGSLEQLVAARVLQGAGAAMVEPTVLALITTTMPASRRGLAFGVQGIAAGLGVVLGPTLGGVITTSLSWEYIFLINVPVGAIAVVAAMLVIPESRAPDTSRTIDLPGVALSSAGLFCLVFPIIEGQRLGWTSPLVVGMFIAAALLLVGFLIVQRRVAHPLIELSLFADRLFAVGNILRAAVQFVTLGLFFPLVLFLQLQLGYSPIGTAVVLLPLVLTTIVASPLAGAVSDRADVRWLVVPGFLLAAAGAAALAHQVSAVDRPLLLVALALTGIGLGVLEAPTTSATLRDVPAGQAGIASGISYVTLLVGAELGLAVTAAVLQNRFAANLGRTGSEAEAGDVASQFVSGHPPPQPVDGLDIGAAFSSATSTALLVCAAVAVLAAILGTRFTPKPTATPTTDRDTN